VASGQVCDKKSSPCLTATHAPIGRHEACTLHVCRLYPAVLERTSYEGLTTLQDLNSWSAPPLILVLHSSIEPCKKVFKTDGMSIECAAFEQTVHYTCSPIIAARDADEPLTTCDEFPKPIEPCLYMLIERTTNGPAPHFIPRLPKIDNNNSVRLSPKSKPRYGLIIMHNGWVVLFDIRGIIANLRGARTGSNDDIRAASDADTRQNGSWMFPTQPEREFVAHHALKSIAHYNEKSARFTPPRPLRPHPIFLGSSLKAVTAMPAGWKGPPMTAALRYATLEAALEALVNKMGYVSKLKTQIVALRPGLQPLRRELETHNRYRAQLAATAAQAERNERRDMAGPSSGQPQTAHVQSSTWRSTSPTKRQKGKSGRALNTEFC